MIEVDKIKNIYVYTNKVNMRFGIYSIQKLLALRFKVEEIIDSMFIFVSRNRKTVKIYYENHYSMSLIINKLKNYKFQVNDLIDGKIIEKEELEYLLRGGELSCVQKEKIYI